jgi:hypothetical protein
VLWLYSEPPAASGFTLLRNCSAQARTSSRSCVTLPKALPWQALVPEWSRTTRSTTIRGAWHAISTAPIACCSRPACITERRSTNWKRSIVGGPAVAVAREAGANRFVQVSAIGADSGPPPRFDDGWWASHYAAKHAADEALRASGLRWTVIRPGALSHAGPTGHVSLS